MRRRIAALVRHGDYLQLPGTPSAHQPFPLTDKGRTQAIDAARSLTDMAAKEEWVIHPVIHCSSLLRGYQTASLIAENMNDAFVLKSHDALAERGLGSAANLTIDDIESILASDPRFDTPPPDWKSDSHYRLPLQGAESLMDAGTRVAERIVEVVSEVEAEGDAMIIFVGHGAAFRHAAHRLGVLALDDVANLGMYHGVPVAIEASGDGTWTRVAGEWKVRGKAERTVDWE